MAPPDIWTQTGQGSGLLVDANGAPWYCTQCPCSEIQSGIKERQYAFGITNLWNAGDPTNTANLIATLAEKSDYNLTQLKAYVNAIATVYLDGEYTGGASTPTLLTGTYANSATSSGELLILVLAMLETLRTATTRDSTYFAGEDLAGGNCAGAKSGAEADYQVIEDLPIAYAVTSLSYAGGGPTWEGFLAAAAGNSRVAGMTAQVAHVVKVYGLAEIATPVASNSPGTITRAFHKQGRDVANENNYGLVHTSVETSVATYDTGDILATTAPATWPTCPALGNQRSAGFSMGTWLGVIDWSFDNQ